MGIYQCWVDFQKIQISQIMIVGVISYLPNFKVVKSNHVLFGFQIFKILADFNFLLGSKYQIKGKGIFGNF